MNNDINPKQSLELLKELHILTRDGKLNQDSRRKLKQVYHLTQFIEPLLKERMSINPNITLVDHGAGKSYLGFILYDLFFKELNSGEIIGIETREELVKTTKALAQKCHFDRMKFFHLSAHDAITSQLINNQVDIVTALHACNTATDDAIAFGLKRKAPMMALIPCCQAEVANVLKKNKNHSTETPLFSLSEIWRHPIHTREFGSHITNVLRCLQLEAHSYQVTVTELIGWEHSMKNELIIAKYNPDVNTKKAREKLEMLLKQLNLEDLKERFFIS
jgi:hypothetical protein